MLYQQQSQNDNFNNYHKNPNHGTITNTYITEHWGGDILKAPIGIYTLNLENTTYLPVRWGYLEVSSRYDDDRATTDGYKHLTIYGQGNTPLYYDSKTTSWLSLSDLNQSLSNKSNLISIQTYSLSKTTFVMNGESRGSALVFVTFNAGFGAGFYLLTWENKKFTLSKIIETGSGSLYVTEANFSDAENASFALSAKASVTWNVINIISQGNCISVK